MSDFVVVFIVVVVAILFYLHLGSTFILCQTFVNSGICFAIPISYAP